MGEGDRHARFSPACAGNGEPGSRRPPPPPVQPRVCGERASAVAIPAYSVGSAPRVRGTGFGSGVVLLIQRFSPACAGNGRRRRCFPRSRAVQPRVCGERDAILSDGATMDGSAPRVRGTGCRPVRPRQPARFSPACAGNGSRSSRPADRRAVQPRVCGERALIWARI